MSRLVKALLILEPQKEGGWTVTSPTIPELITEVDDLNNLHNIVSDAISAVIELYKDMGKEIPAELVKESKTTLWFESLFSAEV